MPLTYILIYWFHTKYISIHVPSERPFVRGLNTLAQWSLLCINSSSICIVSPSRLNDIKMGAYLPSAFNSSNSRRKKVLFPPRASLGYTTGEHRASPEAPVCMNAFSSITFIANLTLSVTLTKLLWKSSRQLHSCMPAFNAGFDVHSWYIQHSTWWEKYFLCVHLMH